MLKWESAANNPTDVIEKVVLKWTGVPAGCLAGHNGWRNWKQPDALTWYMIACNDHDCCDESIAKVYLTDNEKTYYFWPNCECAHVRDRRGKDVLDCNQCAPEP